MRHLLSGLSSEEVRYFCCVVALKSESQAVSLLPALVFYRSGRTHADHPSDSSRSCFSTDDRSSASLRLLHCAVGNYSRHFMGVSISIVCFVVSTGVGINTTRAYIGAGATRYVYWIYGIIWRGYQQRFRSLVPSRDRSRLKG